MLNSTCYICSTLHYVPVIINAIQMMHVDSMGVRRNLYIIRITIVYTICFSIRVLHRIEMVHEQMLEVVVLYQKPLL